MRSSVDETVEQRRLLRLTQRLQGGLGSPPPVLRLLFTVTGVGSGDLQRCASGSHQLVRCREQQDFDFRGAYIDAKKHDEAQLLRGRM